MRRERGDGPRLASAAIVFVVLCVSVASCQAPEPVSQQLATNSGERDEDLGIVLQTSSTGAALDAACSTDQECTAPLRCLELKCVIPPGVDGTGAERAPRVLLNVGSGKVKRLYVEVADTRYETTRGLMFRLRMAADWGMIFVFGDESPRSFWMRNTFIPLDMIFVDRQGAIVSVAEDAKPLEEGPKYQSRGAARYVIEVNAGYAKAHGIQAGQQIRLIDVPGVHEPSILQ